MKANVQARLDDETRAVLERLVRRLGWSSSEVVREGIRLVEKHHSPSRRLKLIGVGEFDSGIPDLASNKKHLESLGEKSMGRNWQRPAKGRSK